MDELTKLLENAGMDGGNIAMNDDDIDQQASDALNRLSSSYIFDVDANGMIDVYVTYEEDDRNERRVAQFQNFDNMLNSFGKCYEIN